MGTGEQTRSYLYIDDCIDAVLLLMKSNHNKPINIGSEDQISINNMIRLIMKLSGYNVEISKNTSKPIGVMGRSSNNDLIKKTLNWSPLTSLEEGLSKTYNWILTMLMNKENQKTTIKFSLKTLLINKISICIPFYETHDLTTNFLDSIINEDFINEIIISDDCSQKNLIIKITK